MHRFDVIIVGGGVVGLSAAVLMDSLGYKTAVIDKKEIEIQANDDSNRVYALNKASLQFLDTLKILSNIPEGGLAYYRNMFVWDEKNKAHIQFNSKIIADNSLGAIVKEPDLKKAILKKIQEHSIKLISCEEVTSILEVAKGIEIQTDKNNYIAKLLIAADGPQSRARQLLKIELTTWPYKQHAVIGNVKTSIGHNLCAYQVFTNDGTIAFLPLKNQNHSSIVWCGSEDNINNLKSLSDEKFAETLTKAFSHKLGDVELITKRQYFPLHMRHVKNYIGKHYLLAGDCAHTIHPLAGLGLNLGIGDINTYAEILKEINHPPWSLTVLRKYQRQRKAKVWETVAIMEGFQKLFLSDNPVISNIRGVGLNLANHSNILKRFFITTANQ